MITLTFSGFFSWTLGAMLVGMLIMFLITQKVKRRLAKLKQAESEVCKECNTKLSAEERYYKDEINKSVVSYCPNMKCSEFDKAVAIL